MSKYVLSIRSNENFKDEVQQAVGLLQKGDLLSISMESNVCSQSVIDTIEEENLTFKHVTGGKKEYILAKK